MDVTPSLRSNAYSFPPDTGSALVCREAKHVRPVPVKDNRRLSQSLCVSGTAQEQGEVPDHELCRIVGNHMMPCRMLSYHWWMRYLPRPIHPLRNTISAANQTGAHSSRLREFGARCLPVVLFFALAFALDQLTQQRYSAVFGSAAIVASVLSVLPMVRPAAVAIGTYGGIWIGFNLLRAWADDAGLALGSQSSVARFEAALFGGALPAQWLQERFYDPERTQLQDVLLALVHASFFVMPFVVAGVLWVRYRIGVWPVLLGNGGCVWVGCDRVSVAADRAALDERCRDRFASDDSGVGAR